MKIIKITKISIFFSVILICLLLSFPKSSFAANMPQINMPVLEVSDDIFGKNFTPVLCVEGQLCAVPWIGQYLQSIYKYGIGIISLLAVIVMMTGGLMWMSSAGDSGRVNSAKGMISASLTGIVIALTSYIILFTINPELTKTNPLELTAIKEIPHEPGYEASEDVVAGRTKGMECFYDKYGHNEEEVSARLTWVTFRGMRMQMTPKAAQALAKAEEEISRNYRGNYNFVNGGTFNWRENRNNPSQQSLHSFGIALDLNPATNPNGSRVKGQTCETDLPVEVVTALKNNGFRWGGDYTTVCDAMHFEWIEECKK